MGRCRALQRTGLTSLLVLAALAACQNAAPASAPPKDGAFPEANRPVATVVATQFSNEPAREAANEARIVMDWAGTKPGMTVADIGAGEGYYTVRLGDRVGAKGRVLAQDIDRAVLTRLGERVARDRLDNVSIMLGAMDDPRLPPASFDRVFMIHMYHEIASPYAFLWHLRPALKGDGEVVIVDADRPTANHGTPPKLLFCELQAVGYRLTGYEERPDIGAYIARFAPEGDRPEPAAIRPCAAPEAGGGKG
ncbi:class I SAM-dependent methyltransferase [Novosphingopyxis sp.]|uniref:class I SAM-dependent methyltransferase n=1 Tax=Novosphingopyxis sp. TaxID=2709690 RepID=UPI003B5C8652